jgi:putative oxidoreductase
MSLKFAADTLYRIAAAARIVTPPVLRVALALPFLRSGLTRWDGPASLAPSTLYLFEEQFRLHLFGHEYPLPMPDHLALLTACAEIALPVLLLLGLGTRLAALALLVMTGVIQLVIPEGWANFHLAWAALALAILAHGPGALALDCWIGAQRAPFAEMPRPHA